MTTAQNTSGPPDWGPVGAFGVLLTVGSVLIAAPSILRHFTGFENIVFLLACQILGALLLLVTILYTIFIVFDDDFTLGVELAQVTIGGFLAGAGSFLVLHNLQYYWGFGAVALMGLVILVIAGIRLVYRARNHQKLSPLERKLRLRTRLRQRPLLFFSLAVLIALLGLALGFLATSPTSSLWTRLVFFAVAGACFLAFGYIVHQSRKARRYRGDQDLGASGVTPLETMKVEFQDAQRSLGKLATEMGTSIRQIDEMIQTTVQLEEAAQNARHLATLSEEQTAALLDKLKRERISTNLWSALYFGLGVLVTLATTYRVELIAFIQRILLGAGL